MCIIINVMCNENNIINNINIINIYVMCENINIINNDNININEILIIMCNNY